MANRMPVEDALYQAGIKTGDGRIPWQVATSPYPVTPGQMRDFELVSTDCFQFLETVANAIRQASNLGTAICQRLDYHPQHDPIASTLMSRQGQLLGMTRPDIIRTAGGELKIAEIETMIGGLGVATALRASYDARGLGGIPQAYAAMMWQMYTDHRSASRRPTPNHLTVGVVNPASKSLYDWEFHTLAGYLTPFGINLILGRPEEVAIRPGGEVWLGEYRLDAIHRFFRSHEIAGTKPVFDVLQRISQRRYVPIVQPWLEILEDKALMALFHEPELRPVWRHALGDAPFRRLEEIIPPTWIVGPHSQLIQDLHQRSAGQRPYWLKQARGAWGGHGVYFGDAISSSKWKKVLEAAWGDFLKGRMWIVQEHCAPAHETISVEDKASGQIITPVSGGRFNPFTFWTQAGPQLADFYVTARANHKVHGATDATFTPVSLMG